MDHPILASQKHYEEGRYDNYYHFTDEEIKV